MSNLQSNDKSVIKWTDIVTSIAAFFAIVISIWSLIQSCKSTSIAEDSNEIASTALAHDATQDARQSIPKIEINYYLAESPDLLSDQDAQWISRRQLVPLFIQSSFWITERSEYQNDSQKRYLFVFIINQGPGRLERANISNINWNPKKDQQVPIGLNVEKPLGVLPSGAFYALLVDVLDSPDPVNYLDSVHFELQKFELIIDLTDELGRSAQIRVPWEDIEPLNIEIPW